MDFELCSVSQFPKDDGFWVVRWYGGITRRQDHPNRPYLTVYLSKLKAQTEVEARKSRLHIDSDFEFRTILNPTVLRIQGPLLPVVPLGSVWRHRRHCFDIRAEHKNLTLNLEAFSLRVSKGKGREDKANPSEEDKRNYQRPQAFYMPQDLYRLARDARESPVLVLTPKSTSDQFGPNTRIVVPMMELIRFYYCRTGRMALALMNNQLKVHPRFAESNGIYNAQLSTYDYMNDRPFVRLRTGMSHHEVWGAVLLAYSSWANDQAKRIGNTIQASGINSGMSGGWREAHPTVYFPFRDEMNTQFSGIQISHDGFQTILILRFLKCDHPLPYSDKTPGFELDNGGGISDPNNPDLPHMNFSPREDPNLEEDRVWEDDDQDLTGPLLIKEEEPSPRFTSLDCVAPAEELTSIVGKVPIHIRRAATHKGNLVGCHDNFGPADGLSVEWESSTPSDAVPINVGMDDAAAKKKSLSDDDSSAEEPFAKPRDPIHIDLRLFLEAIDLLDRNHFLSTSICILGDPENDPVPDDPRLSYFPSKLPPRITGKSKEIDAPQWIFLEKRRKGAPPTLRRHVAICQITTNRGDVLYLFEVERRPPPSTEEFSILLVHDHAFRRLNELQLKDLLSTFVHRGRPGFEEKHFPDFRCRRTNHLGKDNAIALARRITMNLSDACASETNEPVPLRDDSHARTNLVQVSKNVSDPNAFHLRS